MDIFAATYIAMFGLFLAGDFGLFSNSNDTEAPTDPVEPTDPPPEEPTDTLYDPSAYNGEIQGTEGDDDLGAEAETDLAWFLHGGDDTLDGSSGNDYAEGGAGNDVINMREGDDIVLGGAGDDDLDGGIGSDTVYGEDGNDIVAGNGGQDFVYGGVGNDTVLGGSGSDAVYGGDGDDYLSGLSYGQSASNHATQIDGIDSLFGGNGNDTLLLGQGDSGTGGAGTDLFQIDHRQADFDGVINILDYTAADQIEVHYIAQKDANGTPIVPDVTVEMNDDALGGVIRFDGAVIAHVTGKDLSAATLRLVPV